MEAANRVSQRLSYSSTRRNAGGLNFRVRDGYGCEPHRCGRLNADSRNRTAFGVGPSGPAPMHLQSVIDADYVYVRSSLRLDSFVPSQCGMNGGSTC